MTMRNPIMLAGGGLLAALAFAAGLWVLLSSGGREDGPSAAGTKTVLDLWGATDGEAIAPLIARFEAEEPGVEIAYTEFNTAELFRAVAGSTGGRLPDLVMSSAMDLQVALVNDGFAAPIDAVPETPEWSRWRDELFGFTREPVALVYDRRAFEGRALPRTRSELATMLRDDPAFFDGRVGTYDIALSGVGYMFATQDAQRGYQATRLVESLGRAHVRTYCCTFDMIADVSAGRLVLAYNVIASYAAGMVAANPDLGLLLLSDYALVFTRSIFVTQASDNREEAARFVRFLLSPAGQAEMAESSSLFPLTGPADAGFAQDRFEGSTALLPIRLRPGLLTWLDRSKQRAFLNDWQSSMEPAADDGEEGSGAIRALPTGAPEEAGVGGSRDPR
ncbi:ABC transporter substrate-binding protein [Fulvimarina endophytica]|uniref:ABC transporter substrate-binding protein n=1 Tax=Fulvimarina endophytica TaxID=2293836 RepID=A0A371X4R2_9HYPH|nr:ABC transporter substrate-binding protein [Fulvimarina endophytica]RFC64179.1 ABC transporter substrate-binding protein [Fulvimarina endophytica]